MLEQENRCCPGLMEEEYASQIREFGEVPARRCYLCKRTQGTTSVRIL